MSEAVFLRFVFEAIVKPPTPSVKAWGHRGWGCLFPRRFFNVKCLFYNDYTRFDLYLAFKSHYSIHLDLNSKQGKTGYDPNWGKLTELAINLETSPLYVFYYLKQWKRGKDADIPSANRIALYLYDFYPCFDPYVTEVHRSNFTINMEEQSPLNHPKKLTELYRQFYRANKRYNPKANAVLKPINVAADRILKGGMYQGEALVLVVAAEVASLMNRVHASTAEGRWILSDREQERQKILSFARYFVIDVFEGSFKGDQARLAGRQLNLIRDTCEFLYRLEQDRENQELKAQGQPVDEDSENNN